MCLFHQECLRAGSASFVSSRHTEMLYATLTAWGMHRLGPARAKLTSWARFRRSVRQVASAVAQLRHLQMLQLPASEYSDAVRSLESTYRMLDLTESAATVVVNSKALHHLLPDLIPPIDRQHTLRFFKQPPGRWRNSRGAWRPVMLPTGLHAQFSVFCEICDGVRQLADDVGPDCLLEQADAHGISVPKTLDNAIVNYVRTVDETRARRDSVG